MATGSRSSYRQSGISIGDLGDKALIAFEMERERVISIQSFIPSQHGIISQHTLSLSFSLEPIEGGIEPSPCSRKRRGTLFGNFGIYGIAPRAGSIATTTCRAVPSTKYHDPTRQ